MNPSQKRKGRKLQKLTDLSDFYDRHVGEKCFIVGAGPSLALLDLSEIHQHVVIAVNSAAMLMPWDAGPVDKRFWVSNDVLCLRWSYFWTHVAKANCTKIVRTSWKKHQDKLKGLYDFRFFSPRESEQYPFLPDDDGLCFTSSVPTSLDFALKSGCSEIYLIGVDQRMFHGNSHFWQMWPEHKWPRRSDKKKYFRPEQSHQLKVFDDNRKVFESLHKQSIELGVKVYNCSGISTLKMFPNISLLQALE